MSGSEGGENDGNKRDRQDKNEARRAGDWEMVFKSTGDWFGSVCVCVGGEASEREYQKNE